MVRNRRVSVFKEEIVGDYAVAVFGFKGGGYGAMIRECRFALLNPSFTICNGGDGKPQVCPTIDAAFAYGQTQALVRTASHDRREQENADRGVYSRYA